jgi:purine-cytosine permease-like protein
MPKAGDQATVWTTGLLGAALSAFSGAWLERYAGFMLVLGGTLVPIGGILLARFYLIRSEVRTEALYDRSGEFSRHHGFDLAGLTAWAAGAATYYLARGVGGTLPSLVVAVATYLALKRGQTYLATGPLRD